MLDFVNKIITIESAVWCVLIFFLNNTYKIVRDVSFDIAKLRKYNSIVLRDYSDSHTTDLSRCGKTNKHSIPGVN